jgi:hypothetical protein
MLATWVWMYGSSIILFRPFATFFIGSIILAFLHGIAFVPALLALVGRDKGIGPLTEDNADQEGLILPQDCETEN